MMAVKLNNMMIVQLLLNNGASRTLTEKEAHSVMIIAAAYGHVHILELLLRHGLSVTTVDNAGSTQLMTAAAHGHKPAAEWLLQQRVAVSAVDNIGKTALHHASGSSCDEAAVIELLLANGADVHKLSDRHVTALHLAAFKGNVECARVLIDAGADVTNAIITGMTSLNFALTANQSAMAELLLEDGATAVLNGIPELCGTGITAFMACATADTAKVVLAAGADVHEVNEAGDTCLHAAVRHKLAVPVVCLLIKASADLHAINNEGKTAAQLAHDAGNALLHQLLNRAAQQQEHM
jgi:uncharacterized protein